MTTLTPLSARLQAAKNLRVLRFLFYFSVISGLLAGFILGMTKNSSSHDIVMLGEWCFVTFENGIRSLVVWLGFIFTINAFGSVHKARLQREMHFGRKVIPELGNTIIKGAISIVFATNGYGAWSLVYGQLSGLAASIILLWIVVPWVPRLVIISDIARQLFKYGISIMAGYFQRIRC